MCLRERRPSACDGTGKRETGRIDDGKAADFAADSMQSPGWAGRGRGPEAFEGAGERTGWSGCPPVGPQGVGRSGEKGKKDR